MPSEHPHHSSLKKKKKKKNSLSKGSPQCQKKTYVRANIRRQVKFGWNVVKKKQHKNYQDEDKKSVINLKNNNSQIKKPHLKMIPIKDNYKFGTDPTMEDQIRRTNNWIYKTKKSNLDRPSGPVAQRMEALSLYGSRWALSVDSGFNSYPS